MSNIAQITVGIDVSKDTLAIHCWEQDHFLELDNEPADIQQWLKSLSDLVRIAIEPTSHYHLNLVLAALDQGHTVYLVNPRQLAHYREAINLRHKTDPHDAWLLARYLVNEHDSLEPYQPQSPQAQQLWGLLHRRALVVKSRQQLQQSLAQEALSVKALMSEFKQVLQRIDHRIQKLIMSLGWQQHYRNCCSVPGIGPLSAVALVAAYHRGAFASSDAFVAFMGLDIRMRESGQYRGRRKLTKRGPAELRRLLYCAAQAARCCERFEVYRQNQIEKGRSKIAANVALSRKLARIAFTLMSTDQMFQEEPKMA
mgnify:CR=1 FL=1